MGPLIDIRTAAIFTAAVSLTLGGGMLVFGRSRRIYPGFRAWMIGMLLCCGGLLLFAGRGVLPDLLSVVVANTAIVAVACLIILGTRQFLGETTSAVWGVGILASHASLFTYFTYVQPDIRARIIVVSVYLAVLSGVSLWFVSTRVRRRWGPALQLELALWTVALWSVGRAVVTGLHSAPLDDFMRATGMHGATFVVMVVALIAMTMGFVMLNAHRLEQELASAQEEVKVLQGIIPICAWCKRIRSEDGSWSAMEAYISAHSEAAFSHGICGNCEAKIDPEMLER